MTSRTKSLASTLTPDVSLSTSITLSSVGNVLGTEVDLGLTGIGTHEVGGLTLDDLGGITIDGVGISTSGTDSSGKLVTTPVTGGTNGGGGTLETTSSTSGTLGGSGNGDI